MATNMHFTNVLIDPNKLRSFKEWPKMITGYFQLKLLQ